MQRIRAASFFVLILAVFIAVGCAAGSPEVCKTANACVAVGAGEMIKVGMAVPTTGSNSQYGIDMVQAAKVSVADVGQFEGHGFGLVLADDKATTAGGAAAAGVLVANPSVVAVVGDPTSGASQAAMPIYEKAMLPMVSPSATRIDLTRQGSLVFNRVIPNDAYQAEVAAHFIFEKMGRKNVAIIHDGGLYGQGLAERLRDVLTGLGGQVVAFEAITPGQVDYSQTLRTIAVQRPDAVIFGGNNPTDAAVLASQRADSGLGDALFMSGDSVYGDTFIQLAGDKAEGYYVTAPAEPPESEAKVAFDQIYLTTFKIAPGSQSNYTWAAYDATSVIIAAVEKVAIVGQDGKLYIPRAALVAAVRATSGYKGLTGVITCDKNGECGAGNFDILVVKNGAWVKVNP
jgi:branched-chain amino acid transport system substrate-binding protein